MSKICEINISKNIIDFENHECHIKGTLKYELTRLVKITRICIFYQI